MPRSAERRKAKASRRAKGHSIEGQSSDSTDDISGMADPGPEVGRSTQTKKPAKQKMVASMMANSQNESVERSEQKKVVGAVGRPNLRKRKAVDYSEDGECTDGEAKVLENVQDAFRPTKSKVSKSPSSDEDEPEDSDSNNSDEDELHEEEPNPTKMKRKYFHNRTYTERNVPCPSCDTKVASFGHLCIHVRSRHPDLKITNQVEWNRMEACAKRRKEVGDGLFPCTVCDKKLRAFHYLSMHIGECHPNKLVLDEFGYKVVPRFSKKVPKNKFQWQCPFCKTSTTTVSTFQMHLNRNHLTEGSIEVNGRVFTPRKPLPYGFYHKSEYVCEICERVLKTLDGLKRHVRKVHPEMEVFQHDGYDIISTNVAEKLKWTCSECLVVFGSSQALRDHVYRLHPNKKDMTANGRLIIPKKMTRRWHYKCPYCPKLMQTQRALNIHVGSVHEGKGHKKEIRKQLKLIASGKSLHICNECTKPCLSMKNLRQHIAATHYDLLPYNKHGIRIGLESLWGLTKTCCKFCNAIRSRSNMPKHIMKKHYNNLPVHFEEKTISIAGIEKRFKNCPECNLTLTGKGTTLNLHMRKCHESMLPYKVDENYIISHKEAVSATTHELLTLNRCQEIKLCCSATGCEFEQTDEIAYLNHLYLHHRSLLLEENKHRQ